MSVIYTDAGMNKRTGDEAWGCVVDEKGRDLIEDNQDLYEDMKIEQVDLPVGKRFVIKCKFNDVKTQQNNGGELCALVGGLRTALRIGCKKICCDSQLLVTYWKIKVNPKTLEKMDEKKKYFISQLQTLYLQFEKGGGELVKIPGGENKADLGYHKN